MMRVSRPINGQRLSSAAMRHEQAGCGDFAWTPANRAAGTANVCWWGRRTCLAFARTDANDPGLTFAGSKSRSAAARRRAALCYRPEYNEFTPEALLEGR